MPTKCLLNLIFSAHKFWNQIPMSSVLKPNCYHVIKLNNEYFVGIYLPLERWRASSSTICLVCLTTIVSKRASSTRERRLAGYPFWKNKVFLTSCRRLCLNQKEAYTKWEEINFLTFSVQKISRAFES